MATTSQLLSEGFFGSIDAAVQIRETANDPHSGAGGRGYLLSLAGGMSFEVLIDRGLDIGAAWAGGQPIGWRAPMTSPGIAPTALDWLGRFGGGLLVTCGLDNIGLPRDGYGQHGSHHDTRAGDVACTRLPATATEGPGIRISGVIDSVETFGRTVRVYREVTSRCDVAAVTVRDRIVNEGYHAAQIPVLYHFNIGAPTVMPGARIEVSAEEHVIREAVPQYGSWDTYPQPTEDIRESVWCHSKLIADADGRARASVTSPDGRVASVTWNTDALPEMVQWILPVRGRWALGLEPANAPIFGSRLDEEGAGRPVLEAGQEVVTELTFALE